MLQNIRGDIANTEFARNVQVALNVWVVGMVQLFGCVKPVEPELNYAMANFQKSCQKCVADADIAKNMSHCQRTHVLTVILSSHPKCVNIVAALNLISFLLQNLFYSLPCL